VRGEFDLDADGERVAHLLSTLGLALTPSEREAFAGSLQQLFASPKFKDAGGSAVWVNNAQQAMKALRTRARGEALVLGLDERHRASILKELGRNGLGAQAMKRLKIGIVTGTEGMNALAFVQQARRLDIFRNQKKLKLRLMVMDGVTLPASFFALSGRQELDQLAVEAYVFFITQSLQAIEIHTSLLPNWDLVRQRLIQA
jgi:hypothetical protein